jgi:hypothetical protein
MKVVPRGFAAHAEPAGVESMALQAALHLFADVHVFLLDLVGHAQALLDESLGRTFRVREIEIEHHPAAPRPERQHQVSCPSRPRRGSA